MAPLPSRHRCLSRIETNTTLISPDWNRAKARLANWQRFAPQEGKKRSLSNAWSMLSSPARMPCRNSLGFGPASFPRSWDFHSRAYGLASPRARRSFASASWLQRPLGMPSEVASFRSAAEVRLYRFALRLDRYPSQQARCIMIHWQPQAVCAGKEFLAGSALSSSMGGPAMHACMFVQNIVDISFVLSIPYMSIRNHRPHRENARIYMRLHEISLPPPSTITPSTTALQSAARTEPPPLPSPPLPLHPSSSCSPTQAQNPGPRRSSKAVEQGQATARTHPLETPPTKLT
ncbi:hypothetical protein Q7P37_001607 [Cladosporium fusiforme]